MAIAYRVPRDRNGMERMDQAHGWCRKLFQKGIPESKMKRKLLAQSC
jgi:hypothetical protein